MRKISTSAGSNQSAPASPSVVRGKLPTVRSKPIEHFEQATILLYGPRKIGKTSLTAAFPASMNYMFEPGAKGLSIYQYPPINWIDFVNTIPELKDNTLFRNLVVDTADRARDMAQKYICDQMGVKHPSEGEYGNVWHEVTREFSDRMTAICNMGKGVMFIAHEEIVSYKTASGKQLQTVKPDLSGASGKWLMGFVDIIAHYGIENGERWLTIESSEHVDAGHRLGEAIPELGIPARFLTPSGDRVRQIPMGSGPSEGYDNIMKAFNNEQTFIDQDDRSTK